MTVFTIGYEGITLQPFIATLQRHRVSLLVDVRELPLSRKAGFSKTRLAEALEAAPIHYVHMRSLGTPRPLRQKLRAEGNYDAFFAAYTQHVEDHPAAFAQLIDRAKEHTVALMCFEADHRQCHRSVLAAKLAAAGFSIQHL